MGKKSEVRSCRNSGVVGGDSRIVTALELDGIFGPARKEATNHTQMRDPYLCSATPELRSPVAQLRVPLASALMRSHQNGGS
jgi:hypothetical protein